MRALFIVIISSIMLLSCTSESERSAPPDSTEKSLFEKVKEQTVKNPDDVDAWYHLADLYDRSELYAEEIAALKKVVALDPGKGYAYIKLGTAYNRSGQYEDAIVNFEKAKQYFPKNPVLYNNLAVSYGKIGKLDQEIATLEKAIALRPRYATARHNLGVALLKKGKREEALKQYAELRKFDEGTAISLKKEIDRKSK